MEQINTLIEIADNLSAQLGESANNEKDLCIDMQIRFEQMSWETFKIANELKELLSYL